MSYLERHLGPNANDQQKMLSQLELESLDELIKKTIPKDILLKEDLNLNAGLSEFDYLNRIEEIASKNSVFKTYIGMGFYNTILPSAIKRNILENPNWYTSYTPYQAEISQGRLEALLNFQTVIIELTGMEIANASLLDESSAASEAMILMYNARSREQQKNNVCKFFVDQDVFPQTIKVIETRAKYLGIEVMTGQYKNTDLNTDYFGAFVQYPAEKGEVRDYSEFTSKSHKNNILVGVAADIMSLVLLTPPGKWGADVVVGSSQRFGVPMGFGGPHAGFFATKEKFKRMIPGRIIGVSKDATGRIALRMALQTREQHIKRERATSNICTAQALLAIMAGMYAVYHGYEGLNKIAKAIHHRTQLLAAKLKEIGIEVVTKNFFDTLEIKLPKNIEADDIRIIAVEKEINLRYIDNETVGISIDETTDMENINELFSIFCGVAKAHFKYIEDSEPSIHFDNKFIRNDTFLNYPVFQKNRTETGLMRYIKKLGKKDISLTDSMISLGSCTMKLNAASTLLPLSWSEIGNIHPFVPANQAEGYHQIIHELGKDLLEITGFNGISFQPNSGASGEYAGLAVIKAYHESKGESQRNVVLIPSSAHGTNPASAAMAGLKVIVVKCDDQGNIDLEDLHQKVDQFKDILSCIMVTYPSTHGVFEESILKITSLIHEHGGQVYMDGANMNAQVGLTNPATIGADVCHLNLHKTFAIPHGGGGPGVGPICVAKHLTEFLPAHPVIETGGINGVGAMAAAPWGSASILTISYAYCKMLGKEGLKKATEIAILNSNYMASRLQKHYNILYRGINKTVAHEMIIDCRSFKQSAGINEIDIAKRLIDYGFHAPTVSFPVAGTLMIEPTESENLDELDRFINAMISIYHEIKDIEDGLSDKENNVLKNAPHSQFTLTSDEWDRPYSRTKAAFPLTYLKENKYWPPIERVDDAYGDRNLMCSCNYDVEAAAAESDV